METVPLSPYERSVTALTPILPEDAVPHLSGDNPPGGVPGH
jgi:hypothetical protein